MKRPGFAGLLLLLAFAVVIIVESHTLLAMIGLDIPARVYYPAATGLVLAAIAALYLLPGNGKRPTNA